VKKYPVAVAFPRNLLNTREELVLDLRPHWLFLATPTLALAAAVILGIVSIALSWPAPLMVAIGVVVVIALIWFGQRYLKWTTTNFVLTSDRLLTRRGVLSKQGTEIPLDRINTVFFHQSLFERIVGAGDLTIESAGEKGSETFSDVRKPSIVQKEIYVQMESNENRKFDRVRPVASGAEQPSATTTATSPVSAGLTPPEQIEKLAELHQRGLISDEEYASKKTELLGRM
jgi:uncharacterized membrane protein YdbT with pleckstrin-like domain